MSNTLKIAVTGAGGQVAYAFLPRLCSGEVFGNDTEIILNLLEVPGGINKLKGVAMELEDCAYPLIKKINLFDDPNQAFGDIDFAFFVGARPRRHGMQRSDLLNSNGPIFIEQGKALERNAKKTVKSVVLGNPANTNCYILSSSAKSLPRENFSSLTFLDHNRAKAQLAKKAQVNVNDITNLAIWGNHSFTQYPDLENAKIKGKPLTEIITDNIWLKGEFVSTLQERGAAIIETRGLSSAASAANALICHIKAMMNKTLDGDFFSSGIISDGSYGVDQGLVFSFPVQSDGKGNFTIVKNIYLSAFAKEKIAITLNELQSEREMVKSLLV